MFMWLHDAPSIVAIAALRGSRRDDRKGVIDVQRRTIR